MMHIAIDARIISATTGRYIERLLHYLQQIDTVNNYTVLLREKDKNNWQPQAPNFRAEIFDYRSYSWQEQFCMGRALKKLNPDLVHFCMPEQPIGYRGKTVTTFHDLTLIKQAYSNKGIVFHTKQQIGKLAYRYILKKTDQIITPSQFTKTELQLFVPSLNEKKIHVTYEAADVFPEKSSPYEVGFSHYILYVGQQSDYKNIKRLGDAHQLLLEQRPNLGLVVVGNINEDAKSNQSYFEQCGYKNIHYTGFVNDEQLAYLYTQCEAYIFPSLNEGFGLPGLEAMGYGAPVISSNASCLPEIYGDAACYFDPYDIEDIAEKINTVITDNTIRQRLIKNGIAKQRSYSWKRMAEETLAIYNKKL